MYQFASIITGSQKAPEAATTPAILTFGETTVHSIQGLRDAYEKEALLQYFMDGSLERWLDEHYYEEQAEAIRSIDPCKANCFSALCKALGILTVVPAELSEEAKARIERLQAVTADPKVLASPFSVAFDQEELSSLLNNGEKEIYLFNNSFSVPIRKAGISYTAVGNVVIENAYTQEQYRKAGISVNGVSLPREVNPDTAEVAKGAALANGYDDFAESHAPLTNALYEKIKPWKLYFPCRVKYDSAKLTSSFKSKYECEKYKEKYIGQAYECAQDYLRPGTSKCLAKETAERYGSILDGGFDPFADRLKFVSGMLGMSTVYSKIEKLISGGQKNLLEVFERELRDNSDFYSMYKFDYFLDLADVETNDYRINEEGFFRVLETVFADNIEYTIGDPYDPVNEIQKDLDDHAATFFGAACREYRDYVAGILSLVEEIGKLLPARKDKEDMAAYLSRACAELAK